MPSIKGEKGRLGSQTLYYFFKKMRTSRFHVDIWWVDSKTGCSPADNALKYETRLDRGYISIIPCNPWIPRWQKAAAPDGELLEQQSQQSLVGNWHGSPSPSFSGPHQVTNQVCTASPTHRPHPGARRPRHATTELACATSSSSQE